MTPEPRIVDKVKKLLALAGSSNPHEAALALQRAQEMMAAHGLSDAVVEVGSVAETTVRSIATATRMKTWEVRLFKAVADAFGCELLFRGKYPYADYIFVGPTQDAELARYAAVVLARRLSKDRARFTKTLPTELYRDEKTAEVDAFCLGWVVAIIGKLERLSWTPARKKVVADYIAAKGVAGEADHQGRRRRGSAESAMVGGVMASEVDLRQPMNGGASLPRLKS